MKKNRKRIVEITMLIIVSIFTILFVSKELINKNKIPEKSINNIAKNKSMAIMISEDGKNYQEYENNTWPDNLYNFKKAECVDNNGSKVYEILTFNEETRKVTLKTDKTVYCALYFDLNKALSYLRKKDVNKTLSNTLVGGMYRYQGVNSSEYATNNIKVVDSNYMCLGTDCTEESDDMYRIIGVTSKGNIKVVKKTALNEAFKTFETNGTIYPDSNLYKKLNSDNGSFLNSLSKDLQNKIVSYDWQYGDISDEEANNNGLKLYEIESKFANSINSKIGMIYLNDYSLSYNNTINCYNGEPDASKCYNSWLNLHNNDTTPSDIYDGIEWLMPRHSGGEWWWYIRGCADNQCGFTFRHSGNTWPCSLRPVFYLDSNIELFGDGTLENPFKILGVNTIEDKSGNKYHGIMQNGALIKLDDENKKGLYFDGTDDYVDIEDLPSTINWNDGFTVEFEAKWLKFNSWSRIFDFGNGEAIDNITVGNSLNTSAISFGVMVNSKEYRNNFGALDLNKIEKVKMVFKKVSDGYELTTTVNNGEGIINKYSVVSLPNMIRKNNYLGRSNWSWDEYFNGYIYNLKITDSNNNVIIWYDFSE